MAHQQDKSRYAIMLELTIYDKNKKRQMTMAVGVSYSVRIDNKYQCVMTAHKDGHLTMCSMARSIIVTRKAETT